MHRSKSFSLLFYQLSLSLGLALLIVACARIERREQPATAGPPTGVIADQGASGPGNTIEEVVSGGQTRRYRLHIPPDYRPGQAMPLVIILHGFSSNAEQQEKMSQMSAKAGAAGFIAVYPEGLGNPQQWRFGGGPESQADVNFIRDLIQRLQAQRNIDPKAIYVTGISNGAQMSYRLACDLSETVAAIGLVSGGYPPFKNCQPVRPVPAVVFHGTADNVLAYEGQPPVMLPVREWTAEWPARNGCEPLSKVTFQKGEVTGETWDNCRNNATVTLYTIADKGHSWPGSNMPARITTRDINATDVMWDFFAAHPQP
jgi:polyhydroxybutyrate depolymerase